MPGHNFEAGNYYLAIATIAPLLFLSVALKEKGFTQVLGIFVVWAQADNLRGVALSRRVKRNLVLYVVASILALAVGLIFSLVALWQGHDHLWERGVTLGSVIVLVLVALLTMAGTAAASLDPPEE